MYCDILFQFQKITLHTRFFDIHLLRKGDYNGYIFHMVVLVVSIISHYVAQITYA